MAKIPTILEAGRADGKLVTSDAIFDKNKEMFQSEINDIQDTLNSDNPNKPLSAKQGKILKDLLDSKVIEAGSVPIDTEPIEGNITHLVNSDGLAKEFNKYNTEIISGGVYDVSSHNNGEVFESLQAILSSSNLSILIPTSARHGGMSIRFIQGSVPNSHNNYVQFHYMSSSTAIADFTNVANWQGVDDEPISNSKNLVKSGGVFSSLGRIDDFELQGNDASWTLKDSNVIPAGTTVMIRITGSITFAGTDTTQTFISIYTRTKNSSAVVEQIYRQAGKYSVIPSVFYYTAPSDIDMILHVEGRWHTDEKLRVQILFGKDNILLEENNLKSIISLSNVHFGNGIINFNNDLHRVELPTFYLKNVFGGISSRKIVQAQNIDYTFTIDSGAIYILCYDIKTDNVIFTPIDYTNQEYVIIADIYISGKGTTDGVVLSVPYCIGKYSINGVSNESRITNLENEIPLDLKNTLEQKISYDTLNENWNIVMRRGFLSREDGSIIDKDKWMVSRQIQIEHIFGDTIILSQSSNGDSSLNAAGMIEYDAEHSYVKTWNNGVTSVKKTLLQSNTKYVAFSFYTPSGDTPIVTIQNSGILETLNRNTSETEKSVKNEHQDFSFQQKNVARENIGIYDALQNENIIRGMGAYTLGGELIKKGDWSYSNLINIDLVDSENIVLSKGSNGDQKSNIAAAVLFDKYGNFIEAQLYGKISYAKSSLPDSARFIAFSFNVKDNVKIEKYNVLNSISLVNEKLKNTQSDIYNDFAEKRLIIESLGRIRSASSQPIRNLIFMHISDTHGSAEKGFTSQVNTAVDFANELKINRDGGSGLKFVLHTGDIHRSNFKGVDSDYTHFTDAISRSNVPFFIAIGNHDVGESTIIANSGTDQEVYDEMIAPMLNTWNLKSDGEGVAHPEGKNYYFNDFTDEKIRFMVVYEYETDFEISESDSTKLKYYRGSRVFSQEQIDWIINSLLTTPEGYGVIIAKHQPEDVIGTNEFAFSSPYTRDRQINNGYISRSFLFSIIKSFNEGTTIDLTYNQTGGKVIQVTAKADFSKKKPNTEFICFCSGHTHCDSINFIKNSTLLELNVGADNDSSNYTSGSDMAQIKGTKSENLINVYSIDRNRGEIHIVRIGADFSNSGQKRNYETIRYRQI